jgi:hypothetical protein
MNSYVLIGGLAAGQGSSQPPRLSVLRISNRPSNGGVGQKYPPR